MTKIFLILSALALGASAFFGFQNTAQFKEDRNARHKANKDADQIWSEIEDEDTPALNTAIKARNDADALLATNTANLNSENDKIDTLTGEIAALKAKLAPLDAEITEAETQIAKINTDLKPLLPPGTEVNKDNIGKTIDDLNKALEGLKTELANKQAEIEIASQAVAANNQRIESQRKRQAERLAGIRANAREGVLTAVNNDWGFAVANLGSNDGITGESQLIVKNGAQRVATLGVVSVEPNLTVLDIRQDSLTGVVQPGDTVIFEKTAR